MTPMIYKVIFLLVLLFSMRIVVPIFCNLKTTHFRKKNQIFLCFYHDDSLMRLLILKKKPSCI